MKRRLLFSVTAYFFAVASAFAGGLVTNTNQSASWARNPSRDASRNIESVYYNPAGLMALKNGLHLSLNNQMIFQQRMIENAYPYLNTSSYEGSVKALLFPNIYGVYKMEKLAFSLGINPIGGGGSATYEKGLPSFEMSPSDLVPSLTSFGVTDYKLDAYFEGRSVYFGYQAGITYKVNDMISVFAGLRYVSAKNTTAGHLQDVQLLVNNPAFGYNNQYVAAPTFLPQVAGYLTGVAIPNASGAASNLQPIIDGGYGTLTFAQAVTNGILTQEQSDAFTNGLTGLGADPTGMSIAVAQGTFQYAATTGLPAKAATLNASAHLLRNQEADFEQTGSGFCPILGLNLTFGEKLNIGIKYEFLTKMELENKTAKDFTVYWTGPNADSITMFPDGQKTKSDMPAMLSMGADYKLTEKLKLSVGGHLFFDKSANFGKKYDDDLNVTTPALVLTNKDIIDKNFYECSFGLEYQMLDQLLLSAGCQMSRTGVNDLYQSDMTNSNSSNTFGAGVEYGISETMKLNLGVSYTDYMENEKTVSHVLGGNTLQAKETYDRKNWVIGLGLNISLGK